MRELHYRKEENRTSKDAFPNGLRIPKGSSECKRLERFGAVQHPAAGFPVDPLHAGIPDLEGVKRRQGVDQPGGPGHAIVRQQRSHLAFGKHEILARCDCR